MSRDDDAPPCSGCLYCICGQCEQFHYDRTETGHVRRRIRVDPTTEHGEACPAHYVWRFISNRKCFEPERSGKTVN